MIDFCRAALRAIGRRAKLVGLAALALVPAGAGAQPAPPAREWTILIFMNGKNDLEPFAIEDFAEIARVGSTDKVSFVVQMGRPLARPRAQAAYADYYDGWSGARRFLVTRDQTPADGQEVEIVGGYEIDMGAPETLEAFLKWGKARYPAKRYAVVIWNHGQGYRLMATDPANRVMRVETNREKADDPVPTHRAISHDADTGNIIYNADVRATLDAAFDGELKLIGFDACLMAMLETAYELKELAPLMVASEELEPGEGWNYTPLAQAITAAPASDEAALAAMIVQSYRDTYRDNGETTLSTLRSDRIAAVASELSILADLLLADRKALFPLIKNARAQRTAYNNPRNPVSIDLIGFMDALEAELVARAPASPALAQARRVRDAARDAVVESYASARRVDTAQERYGSHGIAVYFPISKRVFYRDPWSEGYLRTNEHKPIAFVGKERWSDLLAAYLGL